METQLCSNSKGSEKVLGTPMPKLGYLVMSLEEQLGEIEDISSRIDSFGHRLSNTISPDKNPSVEYREEASKIDINTRLEIVLSRLQTLRINLSELNNKFENLY